MEEKCTVCKEKILVMCRLGTGVCSTQCEKKAKEPVREFAVSA